MLKPIIEGDIRVTAFSLREECVVNLVYVADTAKMDKSGP